MEKPCPQKPVLSTLVAECWRKKPAIFKEALPLLSSTAEILDAIRTAARMAPRGDSAITFHAFAKDREVRGEEILKFTPAGDSLEDYFAGLRAALGGDNFGLMIGGYDRLCPALWARLSGFLEHLVSTVGVPLGPLSYTLLLGDYSGVNFGIRRDRALGMLSFGLMGRKRMLVWPGAYFDEREVMRMKLGSGPLATEMILAEPEPFAAAATEMEFGAGDLAYWPEDWWHVAYQRQAHQPWIILSIGFQVGLALSATVARLVGALLKQQFGADDLYFPKHGLDPATTPPEMQAAAAALAELARSGAIRRSAEQIWRQQGERFAGQST